MTENAVHDARPLPECPVGEADIEAFERDGVTVLRGVFADWVDTLRAGVERNLVEPGPFARHYTPEGMPGHFFGDYCNWERIPEYREFVTQSTLGAIGAALMRSPIARFFHEHVLVKEPGTVERTPWHHDQPYYPVDGRRNVSLWIPLDAVPSATCPEFVRGSHRWGKWFVPTRFTGETWDRDAGAESLDYVPDIEARRDAYDIQSFDLEPGDAIAFHYLTVHGAPPNTSGTQRRRGFSARLLGDDATWAVRSGPTSPPYTELGALLRHGDALDGVEAFPVLYPAR